MKNYFISSPNRPLKGTPTVDFPFNLVPTSSHTLSPGVSPVKVW